MQAAKHYAYFKGRYFLYDPLVFFECFLVGLFMDYGDTTSCGESRVDAVGV